LNSAFESAGAARRAGIAAPAGAAGGPRDLAESGSRIIAPLPRYE